MVDKEERAVLVQSVFLEMRKLIANAILFNLAAAAHAGMHSTDLQVLNLLDVHGAAKPGDLARWTSLSTGGVTVVLDRLEEAGYIQRRPNPADRRSTLVRPVASRMARIKALYRSKGEELAAALTDYSDRDLRILLGFLEKVNQPAA